MINQYQIIDYVPWGIPHVEVHGDSFHYLDLFELVGRQQFMTTFNFKKDSEAYNQYGESALGVIYYEFSNLQKIEADKLNDLNVEKIKIRSPDRNLCQEKKGDLNYSGVNVVDIKSISFLPHKNDLEIHQTGEKKVPNVIEIEIDDNDLDSDVLCQNYLISKNNSGVELIQFEKEQLIGITLGINNGSIDSRILKHFGFDENSIKDNLNIWQHLYKTKDRRGKLSEEEKGEYANIRDIVTMEVSTKILKELVENGVTDSELKEKSDVLQALMKECEAFRPSILLHGQKQIYWDINSYVHITMRHIRDYQLGSYSQKSYFPYKSEDLKTLIEKVMGCIKSEYNAPVLAKPDSNFTRQGSMAVAFNGDHYNVRVGSDGRLIQFHTLSRTHSP